MITQNTMTKTSPLPINGLESMVAEQQEDMMVLPKIGTYPKSAMQQDKNEVSTGLFTVDVMTPKWATPPIMTEDARQKPSVPQEDIDIDAHVAQLSGVRKHSLIQSIPLFSIGWTPKHVMVAVGLAVLVNLMLLSAISGDASGAMVEETPEVSFEPSDMSAFLSQPATQPDNTSEASYALPFSSTEEDISEENIKGIPGRRVVTISPQDRQQLIEKLNFSSDELSDSHNSDIEKYDTYINSKP